MSLGAIVARSVIRKQALLRIYGLSARIPKNDFAEVKRGQVELADRDHVYEWVIRMRRCRRASASKRSERPRGSLWRKRSGFRSRTTIDDLPFHAFCGSCTCADSTGKSQELLWEGVTKWVTDNAGYSKD